MEALYQSLHYLHYYEWNFPRFLTALTSKRGKFQQPGFGAVGPVTTSKLSNDRRGGLNKKGKNPFQGVLPERPKGKFTVTNYSSGDSALKKHNKYFTPHYLSWQQRHRPQLQHDPTRDAHTEHKSSALQRDVTPPFPKAFW